MVDDPATALQAGDITAIGVGLIVVLVVLGFLLSLVFAKIVAKLLVVVVVVGLGFLVWQQRTSIQDKVNAQACNLSTTFFGIHVEAPADVVRTCQHK